MRPRLLLIAPPFSQLNTPYPAITYLTAFAKSQGYEAHQADVSIETLRALFSRPGLTAAFDAIAALDADLPQEGWEMLARRRHYERSVETVVAYLDRSDPTAAHRIVYGDVIPDGPRVAAAQALDDSFGPMGVEGHARHRATLFLDDLLDLIRASLAPGFGLTRYQERLAASAPSYDPMAAALAHPPSLIDSLYLAALDQHLNRVKPQLVGFSAPFPGNLYAALRGGQHIKATRPHIKVALGGGYPNTELRQLSEARLFDAVDYVTLDDGERPLLCLLEHLAGERPLSKLKRTFSLSDSKVCFYDGAPEHDIPQGLCPTPTWEGLDPGAYLSVLEVLNPMHRLWGDGRWNKLTLAHGCYWKKCAFCDVSLDYIGRYDPASGAAVVDHMEALAQQTGQWGFHFVDEAAPPSLLKDVALELLRRGHQASWWGNIRFERRFDADLCRLLAASGCIAISGGLEVASDRLLKLMNKGVTVEQVARVCDAFTRAGVMVHAYLMYGFPTQTTQETVDSLERVRQLFEAGIVHSAFWHRFIATVHSPVGQDPARFGVTVTPPLPDAFAVNDLELTDPTGVDHDALGLGLDTALMNYMNGLGLDREVHDWFEEDVPRSQAPKDLISAAIEGDEAPPETQLGRRAVWLGSPPFIAQAEPDASDLQPIFVDGPGGSEALSLPPEVCHWLSDRLRDASPSEAANWPPPPLATWAQSWPAASPIPPLSFVHSEAFAALRDIGLVLV